MNFIDDGRIEVGDVVQHFKRELLPPERTGSPEYLYVVLAIAIHENTGEPLVVYKALYGDGVIYARPVEEFVSKVNVEKYPTVHQVYRFEKLSPNYEKPM